jgi:hypothetical protein
MNWTTKVPIYTGWYVVREQMYNEGAKWYRYTAFRLSQLGDTLYIRTESYLPTVAFGTRQFAKNNPHWLSLAEVCGWSEKAPSKPGLYLTREICMDFGSPEYRYSVRRLVRKMFRLYIAADDNYPERRFIPEHESGVEYVRLEGA